MSELRRDISSFMADRFLMGESDCQWYGADGKKLDWSKSLNRVINMVLVVDGERLCLHINGDNAAHDMLVPPLSKRRWKLLSCTVDWPTRHGQYVAVFRERKVK